jgi:putative transposase
MAYYRRNLPHWQPDGAGLFITWRLHGCLPGGCGSLASPAQTSAGQAFREWDARLDRASSGPTWLKDPRLAALVVGTIQRGESEKKLYRRLAYVVMSNHVYVLLEPLVSVAKITQWIKGATAREGNRMLGRDAVPFWQHESHDHWVRNESEGQRIVRYEWARRGAS